MKSTNPKGDIIEHSHAKHYSFKMLVNGLYFVHKKALNLVYKELGDGGVILDIGCGIGRMLARIAQRYDKKVELYGIDPSPDMLEITEKVVHEANKQVSLKLKVAYADQIPFDSAKFNVVVCTLAAHHMPENIKREMVKEVYRILKPGGTFVISDLGRPKNTLGKILVYFSSKHSYTKGNIEVIEDALNAHNFKIAKMHTQMGYIEHIIAHKRK